MEKTYTKLKKYSREELIIRFEQCIVNARTEVAKRRLFNVAMVYVEGIKQ